MGSVRFDGEDESQPSTSNGKKCKSSEKLLHDCGAVNYASVPRKLRSAIKKRARESIIVPLPISRKKRCVSNGVENLRENGAKKSRLIVKQGQITKDEEEVAETLSSLADMFSDIANTNKTMLDSGPSKIKSSTIVEAGNSITAAEDSVILNVQEESNKMNTRVPLEATNHSSANVENSQSLLYDRTKMSEPDTIRSCERMIVRDQVSAPELQCGKCHYTEEDKYKEVLSSGTRGSCLGSSADRFWSENTSSATQPSVIKNSLVADNIHYPQAVPEPKKSWKRCSVHVCIARLIKVLRKSETLEGLMPRFTQLTTGGGVEQGLHTSIDNENRRINGPYGVLPFNGFTHSASEKGIADVAIANLSHKSLLQNQQHFSKTSAVCSSLKQGSEFLSLAASEGINRSGYGLEALKQFHVSYEQPQHLSAMHFRQTQNGYSSTFGGCTSAEAAAQVQLPPWYESESQKQKWTSQIRAPYNLGGVTIKQPEWQNRARDSDSLLNYAQALFPNLHSALGSKYQCFSPPVMPYNSSSLALSNVERHHRRLNPTFDRNGATFIFL